MGGPGILVEIDTLLQTRDFSNRKKTNAVMVKKPNQRNIDEDEFSEQVIGE
jgi:hypothetical protein